MSSLIELAQPVKLVILDVDGVLTNGELYFDQSGEIIKRFHVQDGLGIKLLLKANIEVAIITARQSKALAKRVADLGIQHVYQGFDNKQEAYQQLIAKLNLKKEEIAYVGDDLPDLKLITEVGLGISVPNGSRHAKQAANWVTQASGGQGAVREISEFILTAQNKLLPLLKAYQ